MEQQILDAFTNLNVSEKEQQAITSVINQIKTEYPDVKPTLEFRMHNYMILMHDKELFSSPGFLNLYETLIRQLYGSNFKNIHIINE
jgi:hypothetical protein